MKYSTLVIGLLILVTLACGSTKAPTPRPTAAKPPAQEKPAAIVDAPAATTAPANTPVPTAAPTATPAPTIAPTDTPAPVSYGVGQDVKVGEVRWKIIAVKDEGQTLKSDNQFTKDKTTSGIFIRVTFELENQGKEMKSFISLDLIDSQGRKFKAASDVFAFIPEETRCILENLNPNIVKPCESIYEIPKDATGIKANPGGLQLFGNQEAFIELGF